MGAHQLPGGKRDHSADQWLDFERNGQEKFLSHIRDPVNSVRGVLRSGTDVRDAGRLSCAARACGRRFAAFGAGDLGRRFSGREAWDGDGGVYGRDLCAPVLGPTLGGWITDNCSWRWIFDINISAGVLCAVFTRMGSARKGLPIAIHQIPPCTTLT